MNLLSSFWQSTISFRGPEINTCEKDTRIPIEETGAGILDLFSQDISLARSFCLFIGAIPWPSFSFEIRL